MAEGERARAPMYTPLITSTPPTSNVTLSGSRSSCDERITATMGKSTNEYEDVDAGHLPRMNRYSENTITEPITERKPSATQVSGREGSDQRSCATAEISRRIAAPAAIATALRLAG